MQKLHFVKLVMVHYALQEPWNRKLQNFWKLYQNPSFRYIFDLNLTWSHIANVSTQAFLLPP